ncbi:MAG: phenylphosphate carboxylase subunit delta, partial [Gammaproteobacteria bacterium]
MADLAEPLHRVKDRAAKIRLAAFDVDGVLTDGSLILGDRAEQLKVFHTHDGQGLTMLREAGLHIAV